MESLIETKPASLNEAFSDWLATNLNLTTARIIPLAGDAGFRRYYRIQMASDTIIAMDASHSHENCQAFIAIANGLRIQNVRTPAIIAADLKQRFLLLTDFGDTTYLRALQMNRDSANTLYSKALETLLKIHHCQQIMSYSVPFFTASFMWQEWAWHKEWVSEKLLSLTLPIALTKALDEAMGSIITISTTQPQGFMHRDYHSTNLMVLPDQEVGVLDFQDAFIGPIAYDLVSLLRDCYIAWPESQVESWLLDYHHEAAKEHSAETFLTWVDFMSMQRHLKTLLTFARKKVRDDNSHYLQFIPRTMQYLLHVANKYSTLTPLHIYLQDYALPAFAKVNIPCVP